MYASKRFQKHPSDQQRMVAKIINDLGQCDGPPIINLIDDAVGRNRPATVKQE